MAQDFDPHQWLKCYYWLKDYWLKLIHHLHSEIGVQAFATTLDET